ncbi:methylenetetrahydrofolate reductase [Actinospongicola halichondriae]|uniref:methylenetetrahydrofolate reductase n=1 Tax=Actinospongicola halichondriae TaxID=3236844 RepID=UPI003D3F152F
MTRIVELLGGAPTVSFEFSPPKDDDAEKQLIGVLDELAVVHPSFTSVTYGALGSTRERTRDVVIQFNRDHEFPTMAHLTCVGHSKAEINDLLDAYAAGGVHNILALGGDPPQDGTDPGGDFAHAAELIQVVRDHPGNFSVGVAAHPEKHPRSPSIETDRRYLAEKLAMADFGVTQFVWTADPYLRMVDELAALGCDTPVIPGIMLFINVHSMRRMSELNDTTIPDSLWERCLAVDGDPKAVRLLGTDVCTDLSADLLAGGAPGLHLYTMNRSVAALDLVRRLGLAR